MKEHQRNRSQYKDPFTDFAFPLILNVPVMQMRCLGQVREAEKNKIISFNGSRVELRSQ